MATGKRYYWLKLKESFMTSDTIDYFMSQPDGANYVVLYQMLCLKTINTDGRLSRQIGEVIIPYDVEKIRRDCKWFSADTIRVALKLYQAFGLIYEDSDGTLVLADHDNLVGSETDYAEKNRRMRTNQRNQLPPAGDRTGHNVSGDVSPNVPTDIRDEEYRDGEYREETPDIDGRGNNQPSNNTKGKKVFDHDGNAYRAALYLDTCICSRLPEQKPADEKRLQAWADAFDKCNRLDGYSWGTIGRVLKFSQEDSFWQSNILSGGKFREKFQQLFAKEESKAQSSGARPSASSQAMSDLQAIHNMYKDGEEG